MKKNANSQSLALQCLKVSRLNREFNRLGDLLGDINLFLL